MYKRKEGQSWMGLWETEIAVDGVKETLIRIHSREKSSL